MNSFDDRDRTEFAREVWWCGYVTGLVVALVILIIVWLLK